MLSVCAHEFVTGLLCFSGVGEGDGGLVWSFGAGEKFLVC